MNWDFFLIPWWARLISIAILLIGSGAGYLTGSSLGRVECSWLVMAAFLAGMALILIGACWPHVDEPIAWGRRASVILLCNLTVLALIDPFASIPDEVKVVQSVVLLFPLVLGGIFFPRLGRWLETVGCCLVLYSGVAALTYTANHGHSGVGFFRSWGILVKDGERVSPVDNLLARSASEGSASLACASGSNPKSSRGVYQGEFLCLPD